MLSTQPLSAKSTRRNSVPMPPLLSTAAMIGPEGGMLQVCDPESPILGTSLHIPPGALDKPTFIQIEPGIHTCDFGLTPSVKVLPEGLRFNRPVELKMCMTGQRASAPDAPLATYTYNESDDGWVMGDETRVTSNNGVASCQLWRL